MQIQEGTVSHTCLLTSCAIPSSIRLNGLYLIAVQKPVCVVQTVQISSPSKHKCRTPAQHKLAPQMEGFRLNLSKLCLLLPHSPPRITTKTCMHRSLPALGQFLTPHTLTAQRCAITRAPKSPHCDLDISPEGCKGREPAVTLAPFTPADTGYKRNTSCSG